MEEVAGSIPVGSTKKGPHRSSIDAGSLLFVSLLVFAVALGCRRTEPLADAHPPADATVPAARDADAPDLDVERASPARGRALAVRARHGNDAPEGAPNAWIYVPSGRTEAQPLWLVVVFHGHSNCLAAFAGPGPARCRPGGELRPSADLAAQIERSGTGAIAVVPQLAFDRPTSDPGRLDGPRALEALLREILDEHLGLAGRPIARLGLAAVSGGYVALERTMGAAAVRDLIFLDASYADGGQLERHVVARAQDYVRGARRLIIVHSDLRTTTEPARTLGARIRRTMPAGSFAIRETPAEPTAEELGATIAILAVPREHDAIPAQDLGPILAALRE